jgi:probable F420-dependent oxidoreductase
MSLEIKVGVNIVPLAPGRVVEVAQCAESLGYESVWSGEHVALPFELTSEYPGGKPVFDPDSDFLEPLVLLSHLAAATTRLRLGVGIFMLALRDPILVGRAIATVDVLSGGRLDLGIGLGWSEQEYRFVGREFKHRGRLTDELIDALDVLFSEPRPEFHGRYFDFDPIGFEPKPVQKPRPKFHIGGFGAHAHRRAGQRGDGFYAGGAPPEVMKASIAAIDAERKKAGRDTVPFEISMIALGRPPAREVLEEYAAIGVHRVVVTPWKGKPGDVDAGATEAIERYAESIDL